MALQGNPLKCSCENTWLAKWLLRWMRETLQLHTSVVERGQNVQSIVRKITCKVNKIVANLSHILKYQYSILPISILFISYFIFSCCSLKLLQIRKTRDFIKENLSLRQDQQDQSLQIIVTQIV